MVVTFHMLSKALTSCKDAIVDWACPTFVEPVCTDSVVCRFCADEAKIMRVERLLECPTRPDRFREVLSLLMPRPGVKRAEPCWFDALCAMIKPVILSWRTFCPGVGCNWCVAIHQSNVFSLGRSRDNRIDSQCASVGSCNSLGCPIVLIINADIGPAGFWS